MNITKDDSILSLLTQLNLELRGWTIRDHWDADLCAIGVSSKSFPHKLVYVSTYGKPTGKFDYECEQSPSNTEDETDYETVAEGHDVEYDVLLDAMEGHLGTTA